LSYITKFFNLLLVGINFSYVIDTYMTKGGYEIYFWIDARSRIVFNLTMIIIKKLKKIYDK